MRPGCVWDVRVCRRRFCAVGITCTVAWVPCYLSLMHEDAQVSSASLKYRPRAEGLIKWSTTT
jgi:hypothetical protein